MSNSQQFQILVLGDEKVGKSTLIETYITLSFPNKVEKIKADSIIPSPSHDDFTSCLLCDSTGDADDPVLREKLSSADIVFLLHDASRPETFTSLSDKWLPLVQEAFGNDRTKSAVIIRSKNDLFPGVFDYRVSGSQSKTYPSDEKSNSGNGDIKDNEMALSFVGVDITHPDKFSAAELEIGKKYSFISALSIVSAAKNLEQVVDLFVSAEEMFRNPLAPLYTKELGYTTQCLVALQRIFRHCDQDHDGVLSDEEFKQLQFYSLGVMITDDELAQMKALIEENEVSSDEKISQEYLEPIWTNSLRSRGKDMSYTGKLLQVPKGKQKEASASTGITFNGFRKILEMHICRDRQGVVWDILHAYGYGVNLITPPVPDFLTQFGHESDEDDSEEDIDGNDEDRVENIHEGGLLIEVPRGRSLEEAVHHSGCVCLSTRGYTKYLRTATSCSWFCVTSPTYSQQDVVTLLSPQAVDFLYGLFTQKRGIRNEMGLKIAPELAYAIGVLSPAASKIWQSIVLSFDKLFIRNADEANDGYIREKGNCEMASINSIKILYNPMPTNMAVRNWLTLWHTLALHLPPEPLSCLLFQLGFLPTSVLPSLSSEENAKTANSSTTDSCFTCKCFEQHQGRALETFMDGNVHSQHSTNYLSRQAVRKMGVFGRNQVGKTSIVAGFSDLFSDIQKDRIGECIGVRDSAAGGFCLQVQSISSLDPNTSKGGSAQKGKRRIKARNPSSSGSNVHQSQLGSSLPASCFIHYIATEVPGNVGVYEVEEEDSYCHSGDSFRSCVFNQGTSSSQSECVSVDTERAKGNDILGSSVESIIVEDENESTIGMTALDRDQIESKSPLSSPKNTEEKNLSSTNIVDVVTSSLTSEDMFSLRDSVSSIASSPPSAFGSHSFLTSESTHNSQSFVMEEGPPLAATYQSVSNNDIVDISDSNIGASMCRSMENEVSSDAGSNILSVSVEMIDKENSSAAPSSNSNSNSCASSICKETRHWIEANKQTCDIALMVFDAFEMETLDYLLEVDALLPPDIVRVFICTKLSEVNNLTSTMALPSRPDVAYSKCVEYMRERGLPQVEQLFSLDESTITNLKRSIHDTYQRSIAKKFVQVVETRDTPVSIPSTPVSSRSNTPVTPNILSPTHNPHGDWNKTNDASSGKKSGDVNPFSEGFSFSKLMLFCDEMLRSYFPSYKLFWPSILLGLIALYK